MVRSDSEPQPTHEDVWFGWASVAVPLSGGLVLAIAATVWALVL